MSAWCRTRWVPLAVSLLSVVLGFEYVVLWAGLPSGPFDLWLAPSALGGTWLAAAQLVHGHFTTVYATVPGAVRLLAPGAVPGRALGLTVGPQFTDTFAPIGWLLVGMLAALAVIGWPAREAASAPIPANVVPISAGPVEGAPHRPR